MSEKSHVSPYRARFMETLVDGPAHLYTARLTRNNLLLVQPSSRLLLLL